MGELRVGTSGWTYGDWRGRFYPEQLKQQDYLPFYANHFTTTEINYSFYHLPRPKTYENWAAKVPEDFIFAVKASRFITHVKRLKGAEEAWRKFLEHASALGSKLGPVLLQLPPSLRCDTKLLSGFLKTSRELTTARLAFEFRHASWFDPDALELLRKAGMGLVIAQSERYPEAPSVPTAPFVYLRFHGPGRLFASRYSDEQLKPWAERIRKWLTEGRTVYAYFNNDFEGHAIDNAKSLVRMAGERVSKSAATALR